MNNKLKIVVRLKQKPKLQAVVLTGIITSVFAIAFFYSIIQSNASLADSGMDANGEHASNSVLVNFGGENCGSSLSQSAVSLFGDAQTSLPISLLNFSTNSIGDVFSKFISYNPLNNKLYVNDIRDGVNSKIYILDVGLPASLSAPSIATPSYTIANQVLNQFEFDQVGDLYAIDSYDKNTARANIAAYDDTTGIQINSSLKNLMFPLTDRPGDLNSGDIAITPNGRLFCVFGSDTSKIYEITNYKRTSNGNATATFLGYVTKPCYGIAFNNGYIIMAGSNFSGGCYSFKYDINDFTLSPETASSNNSLPIDMTSFSASIGTAKRIVSATKVDDYTYDLAYHIYIQNKGNVRIGNLQITDDLDAVFGVGNVVATSTSWVSNGGQLTLNSSYNGGSDINLLASSQMLSNTPVARTNSTLRLNVRITNLSSSATYYNLAIASGSIGSGLNRMNLRDTSNNYTNSYGSWSAATDPDNNTVSDDSLEDNPTPWNFNTSIALPIELLSFNAKWINESARIFWTSASELNNDYFEIERSFDLITYKKIGKVKGNGTTSVIHNYFYDDYDLMNQTDAYYRLKQVDFNGSANFYKPVHLSKKQKQNQVRVKLYPNPASSFVTIDFAENVSLNELQMDVYDASSKWMGEYQIHQLPFTLYVADYKRGMYVIRFKNDEMQMGSEKLILK